MNNELHEKKSNLTPRTPRNIDLNDANKVDNNNQDPSNASRQVSNIPSSLPTTEETPTTNLLEISSKIK